MEEDVAAILVSEVAMPADKKPVVNLPFEPELLDRIDEYRFDRRFRSRTAAIKFLLTWSLDRNPEPQPADRG